MAIWRAGEACGILSPRSGRKIEGRGKSASALAAPAKLKKVSEPAERVTERWLNSLRLFCHPLRGLRHVLFVVQGLRPLTRAYPCLSSIAPLGHKVPQASPARQTPIYICNFFAIVKRPLPSGATAFEMNSLRLFLLAATAGSKTGQGKQGKSSRSRLGNY